MSVEMNRAEQSSAFPFANMARPVVALRADDSMSCLFVQMSDDLEASGICAAWRSDELNDAPLFVTTPHADPTVEALLRDATLSEYVSVDCTWVATDAGDMMHLELPTRDGRIAFTAMFAATGAKGRAITRGALERWLPTMRAFFELWTARRRARSRERAMTTAINSSDAAIILIDGAGRTMFANDCAEMVLARKDGLRRNGAILSGNRLADTLRLQAAIEHAVHSKPDGRQAPVVALPRTDGRPMLAAVIAANPAPVSERDTAAVLYLIDPDQDIHALAEPACKLYGLSPVETKLTCLLADGRSLTEAADRMRIREQTARSYLKQIFSKTSTNRQAELVQLILKSLIRTAARHVAKAI